MKNIRWKEIFLAFLGDRTVLGEPSKNEKVAFYIIYFVSLAIFVACVVYYKLWAWVTS
jgi:hypothetical protein